MNEKSPLVYAVDDSSLGRKALEAVCGRAGYKVRSFSSPEEAFPAFNEALPDLILTDLVMPGMDGLEFLGWIRSRSALRDVPVIMVSSSAGTEGLERALELGAFDFIRKPYEPPEILARLKSALRYAEVVRELRHAATHDSLTGLATHAELMRELEEGAREACRGKDSPRPFSFMMLDIDHFKSVNDNRGHPAGDAVIRMIADLIRKSFGNLVSDRYGGEEFGVLLPGYDKPMAVKTAEAFIALVSRASPEGLSDLRVTLSAGVATVGDGVACDLQCRDTVDRLVQKADAELYRAKREGRNRVCS